MHPRQKHLFGFAFITLSLLTQKTTAQVSTTPVPPLSSVIQRLLAAHGARWINGEITDWIGEGTLTYFSAQGPQATFDMTLSRKGKLHVQRIVKQTAAEVRTGSDGTKAWDSLGGMFVVTAQGRPLQFLESQTVRSVQTLLNYQAEGLILRDLGISGNARVIEAEDKQGRKTSYYIDNQTSVVTRLEFETGQAQGPFSGKMVPTADAYVFLDYRTIQGALTPFKIERYISGIKVEEMQFTSFRFNASVKDDVFRP